MSNKEFHDKPFDETTLCKLELYRQYLRAWLPTLINAGFTKIIQIFDFFAGPGTDCKGNFGSPFIAASEIATALKENATRLRPDLKFRLYLNEYLPKNYNVLQKNKKVLQEMIPDVTVETTNYNFEDAFAYEYSTMKGDGVANLIFFDQFGVSFIDKITFQKVVNLTTTDFMFFISASTVNRFPNDNNVLSKIPPLSQDKRKALNGTEVVRVIAEAYRDEWMPKEKQRYFLGHFSLKRKANVNGLIFGTGHPAGIDKFLHIAWDMDPNFGEANFDIEKQGLDGRTQFLFEEMNISNKVKEFEAIVEDRFQRRIFTDNHHLYYFAVVNGMLPKHMRDCVSRLKKENKLPKQKLNISFDALNHPKVQIRYDFSEESPK